MPEISSFYGIAIYMYMSGWTNIKKNYWLTGSVWVRLKNQ